MRYCATLFFLFTHLVCVSQENKKEKRVRSFLEPELNYSLLENKEIRDDAFSQRANLGWGLSYLFSFSCGKKLNLLTGLRFTSLNYRFKFGWNFRRAVENTLFIPLYLEYRMKKNFSVGLGTDISYLGPPIAFYFFSLGSNSTSVLDKTFGPETLVLPIVVNVSKTFMTKNGRPYSFVLHFKKGMQNLSERNIKRFDSSGNTISESTFNYKGTAISLSFRYYLWGGWARKAKKEREKRQSDTPSSE